jgi:hypothetical protein
MRNLAPRKEFRDYPDHFPASRQNRVCEYAHQSDTASAIDQSDAGLRQSLP